ncbi:MAG: DUF120 domain-containing protein [Euryarchaeota archaeon]|nr:DUF120 domain-containing protein [Euryarchaeota archaeon]
MNEKFSTALKQIALLGGINDYIAISSRELGEKLSLSQQSASKRILELLEEGYILRDLGARKQRIKITKKGLDALRAEYYEYQRIFEMKDHLTIKGIVSAGMGEGQYYVNQPEYQEQFKEKLGFAPFEGTLNLKIVSSDLPKMEMLRRIDGIAIDGFHRNGRTFGEVRAYPASMHNIDCAVILPSRSHYSEVMEILCKYSLRRTLGLNDGDMVEVRIDTEED